MTCPRCTGFVLTQYEETRCLACGWYDNPPTAVPTREPFWRTGKHRQARET